MTLSSLNGTAYLEGLPLPPGELVDVIVLACKGAADTAHMRALKDSVLNYEQPLEPVAEGDWNALL